MSKPAPTQRDLSLAQSLIHQFYSGDGRDGSSVYFDELGPCRPPSTERPITDRHADALEALWLETAAKGRKGEREKGSVPLSPFPPCPPAL